MALLVPVHGVPRGRKSLTVIDKLSKIYKSVHFVIRRFLRLRQVLLSCYTPLFPH